MKPLKKLISMYVDEDIYEILRSLLEEEGKYNFAEKMRKSMRAQVDILERKLRKRREREAREIK